MKTTLKSTIFFIYELWGERIKLTANNITANIGY